MKIRVNGKEMTLELSNDNALLSKSLELMGYRPNTIIVELNNLIINSKNWIIFKQQKSLFGTLIMFLTSLIIVCSIGYAQQNSFK